MKNTISRHILFWIENQLYNKVGVEELVESTGYSRRTIENIFFEKYKVSLGAYIHKRRMTRCAVLLRLTNLSITEIATQFHYFSAQNFSRAFRRFFFQTPSEYREASNWDFSLLQPPLLFDLSEHQFDMIDVTQEVVIKGTASFIEDYINYDESDFIRLIKRQFQSAQSMQDLWVSISISDSLSVMSGRLGRVGVEVILNDPEASSNERIEVMLPGKYAKITYSGSWYDYSVFSRLTHIKTLTDNKLQWFGGKTFIRYKSDLFSEENVNCELYIPVTSECNR